MTEEAEMSDRANFTHLRYLVRDAVRSQRLDDEARDVARVLAVQFRERARQAQDLAQDVAHTTSTAAARVTTETALPAARRASAEAVTAARSVSTSNAARAAAVGATAGAVASIVMGGAIVAAKRAGIITEAPPREITTRGAKKAAKAARKAARKGHAGKRDEASEASEASESADPAHATGEDGRHSDRAADEDPSAVEAAPAQSFDLASSAAHIAFGMALGAGFGTLYSALPREWRAPLPTVGASVGFATIVWATSYAGLLPALGLVPPPSHDEPGRPITMIASHWIFGAVLGAGLVAGLSRDR